MKDDSQQIRQEIETSIGIMEGHLKDCVKAGRQCGACLIVVIILFPVSSIGQAVFMLSNAVVVGLMFGAASNLRKLINRTKSDYAEYLRS